MADDSTKFYALAARILLRLEREAPAQPDVAKSILAKELHMAVWAEREACAELAEDAADDLRNEMPSEGGAAAHWLAERIRARGTR